MATHKELAEREAICAEARTWIGTPYHHLGDVKGAGCDCAQLIIATFNAVGLVPRIAPPRYSPTWHLHRGEEVYLQALEQYISPGDHDERSFNQRPDFVAGMGDILMFKVGRTFSHSAIVSSWPQIIHSSLPVRMVEQVDLNGTPMAALPMKHYSYWGSR